MIKITQTHITEYIFFASIALLIVAVILFSWFKDGKIIANSEEGLNLVNLTKTSQAHSSTWYPIETGFKSPIYIVRFPTFKVLEYLQQLGFPPYLIQSLLIGAALFIGLISMYLLLKYLLPASGVTPAIGALFYMLNLYTMSQILRRFLYSSMYAWAYLPLFIYFWIKIMENRSFKLILIFSFSSLFFTFTFSHPAYLITFWITAATITICKLISLRSSKKILLATVFISFAGFISWLLFNIWWLYPMAYTSGSFLQDSVPPWEVNYNSLKSVSQYFPVQDILLLRQSWWFGKDSIWFSYYNQPAVALVSIFVLLITIYGLIKRSDYRLWKYLVLIFVLGLFVSKGTNPPFGDSFFYWLFVNFPASGALRNSYEKFGIVFLLAYSCFFAHGLNQFAKYFPKIRPLYLFLSLSLAFGVLVWPIWSGSLFLKSEKVVVPDYYREANSYLNQSGDLRVFHIPFSRYGNVNYSWGYNGQDPTFDIFSRESISGPFNLQLKQIFYDLLPQLAQDNNFPKILGLLGVSNIVVHNDSVTKMEEIIVNSNNLENWDNIAKVKELGNLVIYSIDKSLVRPRVYIISASLKQTYLKNDFRDIITEENQSVETSPSLFISPAYKKISNTEYRVEIRNSEEPYTLVLNNSFDSSWKASMGPQTIQDHFLVNGFANGWLVDKRGDYDVFISFKVWPWD